MKNVLTADIEAELARRAKLIKAEPWITANGHRARARVARSTAPRATSKRAAPADYAAALRKVPRRFTPDDLVEASGASRGAVAFWLSNNIGHGFKRVDRGIYERRAS